MSSKLGTGHDEVSYNTIYPLRITFILVDSSKVNRSETDMVKVHRCAIFSCIKRESCTKTKSIQRLCSIEWINRNDKFPVWMTSLQKREEPNPAASSNWEYPILHLLFYLPPSVVFEKIILPRTRLHISLIVLGKALTKVVLQQRCLSTFEKPSTV